MIGGAVALAGLATVLAACSTPPHPPGALALVVGGRNNEPAPQLLGRASSEVDDALLSGDAFSIVGVSGDPTVLYEKNLATGCDSQSGCAAAVSTFDSDVTSLMNRVRANTPQADTLSAIVLAAKQVDAAPGEGPKQLIVIDNGLQTSGEMPLQYPGALSVPPRALVAQLGGTDGDLRYLRGVHVLLTEIGADYPPQPVFTATDQERLQQLWQGLLTAAGADVQVENVAPSPTAPARGLPSVTPVPLPVSTPPSSVGCVVLRDDQVGFVPNEAVFTNQAATDAVLRPIARSLARSQISASVVGTTALPEAPPYPTSTDRATAVVRELEALGVPGSSLAPQGVGEHFNGFKPDMDATGHLVETEAVQDRLVFIQPVGDVCA
jgi:hypothetical protein